MKICNRLPLRPNAANDAGAKSNGIVLRGGKRLGKAFAIRFTTPPRRKSPIISREVHAVETASNKNTAHNSLSFPIVSLVSLKAERAMIPITAAPIP
jgi:hypothetical protein